MPVTIRAAHPDDLEALAALAARTFPMAAPDDAAPDGVAAFIASVLSADAFAGYLADPARIVLVAETADDVETPDDGETVDGEPNLIGYTMLIHGVPTDPDVVAAVATRPTIDLNKFYVDLDHHGSGVATTLMDAAIVAARDAGMASVWLGVNDENRRAIRFYRKAGFEQVGTKWFRLGERDEHDYVMERRLT